MEFPIRKVNPKKIKVILSRYTDDKVIVPIATNSMRSTHNGLGGLITSKYLARNEPHRLSGKDSRYDLNIGPGWVKHGKRLRLTY